MNAYVTEVCKIVVGCGTEYSTKI